MRNFEDLWQEEGDPSDCDNEERRGLAEYFFDQGLKAMKEHVRHLALTEAETQNRIAGELAPQGVERMGRETRAQALRDFAALLEDR